MCAPQPNRAPLPLVQNPPKQLNVLYIRSFDSIYGSNLAINAKTLTAFSKITLYGKKRKYNSFEIWILIQMS